MRYLVGSKIGTEIVVKSFTDELTASTYAQRIKQGAVASRVAYGRIPAKMSLDNAKQAMRRQLT